MPQLIKNNAIVQDSWSILTQDDCAQAVPQGSVLVPVKYWLNNRDALSARTDIGLWFEGDDEPESVGDALTGFPLIAVNFQRFSDGRGYSIARLIRECYQYKGELRAIGDVLRDQLFYMSRCGFDAFQVRADRIGEDSLSSLKDFSKVYQAAADGVPALFHLR
jgi:uncharacterized protein (DUF934 family)